MKKINKSLENWLVRQLKEIEAILNPPKVMNYVQPIPAQVVSPAKVFSAQVMNPVKLI